MAETDEIRKELAILEEWEQLCPTTDIDVIKAQEMWRRELMRKLQESAERNQPPQSL